MKTRRHCFAALLTGVLISLSTYLIFGDENNLYLYTGLGFSVLSFALPFRDMEDPLDTIWDFIGFFPSLFFDKLFTLAIANPTTPLLLVVPAVEGIRAWSASHPLWIVVTFQIVLADFLSYWSHRALHSRALWPTHAWHHSPKNLNWISGNRQTLVHAIFLNAPFMLAFIMFPAPESGIIAWCLMIFYAALANYVHSNVWIPYSHIVEKIFVTPRFHFVHHSTNIKRTNSNYAFIFTFWDRLFGTYTDPAEYANDQLGLDYEIENWRLLIGLPPSKKKKLKETWQ